MERVAEPMGAVTSASAWLAVLALAWACGAVAVLAYLAVSDIGNTPQEYSRESLSALLWPDHEQYKAFSNLRRTIWGIHQAIGENWLIADRERPYEHKPHPEWLLYTLPDVLRRTARDGRLRELVEAVFAYGAARLVTPRLELVYAKLEYVAACQESPSLDRRWPDSATQAA